MFRTREWVMFVAGCVFILGAIMVTAWSEPSPQSNVALAPVSFVNDGALTEQRATVAATTDPKPADALVSMREKVVAYRKNHDQNPEQFTVATATPAVAGKATSSTFDEPDNAVVQYCNPEAKTYAGIWPRHVVVEEREGVRVVYVARQNVATGTIRMPETLLLQLPAPGRPGVAQYCLPSEVVGVAQDGSLIRNDDVGLYRIFSADTVVGYALDGFPIYGKNDGITVDSCGGAMGPAGYGYVLQSERDAVVQCFRGRPAQL